MPERNPIDFGKFLNIFYKQCGPQAERDPEIQALLKAEDWYDYGRTDYVNPVYSAKICLEALTRSTVFYRVLPKTSYLDKGDSMHYIIAEGSLREEFLGESGAMFSADSDIPDVADLDHLWPAVYHLGFEATRIGKEMSKFQAKPKTDLEMLVDFFNRFYADAIDRQLAGVYIEAAGTASGHGVDSPATSTMATIESLDRMISNKLESGTVTSHVDAATDGDIFWNETGAAPARAALVDRSAGVLGECQIKLPTTPGTEQAYNILDELDDLMSTALLYAPTAERNYVAFCSPKALNKVQDELDPKQRFLEFPMEVMQTIGGVSTRAGALGGKFQVAGLGISGIKVPFFTSPYLQGTKTSSWLWKNTQYATGGVGHIFLVNMDNIEIRHLIPITYQETPNYADWVLGTRHSFFSAMQLMIQNFSAHAALKYIAA